MVSFGEFFGKKKKEEKALTKTPKNSAETLKPAKESPRSFECFLETVLKDGHADCIIQTNQIPALNNALVFALHDNQAVHFTTQEISSYIQSGLTIRCFGCGEQFPEDAISTICLTDEEPKRKATFSAPNAPTLAKGVCPGCGNTYVSARFDIADINVRMQ